MSCENLHWPTFSNTFISRAIDEESGQLVKTTIVKDASGKKVSESREMVEVPLLSAKENLFVLVDEAHRSHYGFLAGFMRRALPHARFIAFTGTPIDKANKSTLAEFYGGRYLDVYTIKQSVEDGATLPIFYDARLPELHVQKDQIDRHLEEKKEKLRRKASRRKGTVKNNYTRFQKRN
jgi:type I restriction enzyme R subunit